MVCIWTKTEFCLLAKLTCSKRCLAEISQILNSNNCEKKITAAAVLRYRFYKKAGRILEVHMPLEYNGRREKFAVESEICSKFSGTLLVSQGW